MNDSASTLPPHVPPSGSHPTGAHYGTPKIWLAVLGLALAAPGFCIPLLAVAGLVIAVIALVKAGRNPALWGGQTIAIVGVVANVMTMLAGCAFTLGLLLPALSVARETARAAKSGTNLRMIHAGMAQYAHDHDGHFPEPGANLLLRLDGFAPEIAFSSPYHEEEAGQSWLVISSARPGNSRDLLLVGNPTIGDSSRPHRSRKVPVLYADGAADLLDSDEVMILLRTVEGPIHTVGGKPWR